VSLVCATPDLRGFLPALRKGVLVPYRCASASVHLPSIRRSSAPATVGSAAVTVAPPTPSSSVRLESGADLSSSPSRLRVTALLALLAGLGALHRRSRRRRVGQISPAALSDGQGVSP